MFLDWLKTIIGNAASAIDLVEQLGDAVSNLFVWLPEEWFYLITVAILILLGVGIWRLFRG